MRVRESRRKRSFTVLLAGALAFACSGIVVVVELAPQQLGPHAWLGYALLAAAALPSALSYAELGLAWPQHSGLPRYPSAAFFGWGPVPLICAALVPGSACAFGAAALATAIALLRQLSPSPLVPLALVLAVFAMLALHLLRGPSAPWRTVALAVLPAVALGVLVISALLGPESAPPVTSGWVATLGGAAITAPLGVASLLGFEELALTAFEARVPRRHVPSALMGCVLATVALGTVATLAAQLDVSAPHQLSAGLWLLRRVCTLSAAAASLAFVAVTLELAMKTIDNLAAPTSRTGTVVTLLLATTFLLALSALVDALRLAQVAAGCLLVVLVLANVAVVVLRYRQPRAPRPFRVAPRIGRAPVPAVFGAAASLALLSQLPGWSLWWCAGGIATITVVWWLKKPTLTPPVDDPARQLERRSVTTASP